MIKRYAALILLTLVVGLAAGCGGDEEDDSEAQGACGDAPAEIAQQPTLPDGFPTPDGVIYTAGRDAGASPLVRARPAERAAGPSHIVEGYRDGELEDAFDAYKDAFESAGYDVTKDEREEDDAEVN